jgi:hypothetical protein
MAWMVVPESRNTESPRRISSRHAAAIRRLASPCRLSRSPIVSSTCGVVLTIPEREFSGYIFDCDGTLADNTPYHYLAWSRAMKDVGGTFPEDLFYAWGGRPTAVLMADLNERFDFATDVEHTVALKESYYLALLRHAEPVQDVLDIARDVHGSALAVARGGQRPFVEATLEALGISEMFDAVICVEDYARGKPAPPPRSSRPPAGSARARRRASCSTTARAASTQPRRPAWPGYACPEPAGDLTGTRAETGEWARRRLPAARVVRPRRGC